MIFYAISRQKDKRGAALLMTIAITSIMVVVVVEQLHAAWLNAHLAATFRDETIALYRARAGVIAAKRILTEIDTKDTKLMTTAFTLYKDGVPVPIEDESITIKMTDESSKFNLNSVVTNSGLPQRMELEFFKRILEHLDIDVEIADNLVDWIDQNDLPYENGVESNYYNNLNPSYKAKNNYLDNVTEITFIKGFDNEVVRKLLPYVTIFSDNRININTASKLILESLDDRISETMINDMSAKIETGGFKDKSEINDIVGMSDIFPNISTLITTDSSHFTIESSSKEKDTTKRIVSTMNKLGSDLSVVYYKVF